MKKSVSPKVTTPEADLKILTIDPWLKPYKKDLMLRMNRYRDIKKTLLGEGGSLRDFANGHNFFGFHRVADGWVYREWAPGAEALFLLGDFNRWDRYSHPLTRKDGGIWEIHLPGKETLLHTSRVKVRVRSRGLSATEFPYTSDGRFRIRQPMISADRSGRPKYLSSGLTGSFASITQSRLSSMKPISVWLRKKKPSERIRNSRSTFCPE